MATLEMQPGRYFSKVWMLGRPEATVDVLAALWRDLPDGLWTLTYRFRYHVDDKMHGSEDHKSAYRGTFGERAEPVLPESEVLPKVERAIVLIAQMLGQQNGLPPFQVDGVVCGTDDAMEIACKLYEKPWANIEIGAMP